MTTGTLTSYGSTPARAGRTYLKVNWEVDAGKHPRSRGEDTEQMPTERPASEAPRSRGEDTLPDRMARITTEAPPLARGGPIHAPSPVGSGGSTPARAGRTSVVTPKLPCSRSPPRSRGEDQCRTPRAATASEAPPLARGGHERHRYWCFGYGSTPARAGRTAPKPETCTSAWKHPRSRGEERVADKLSAPR